MNIVTSHLSSIFGLADTQSPRQRRAYTCSICNTEGHNAMSCSDSCNIKGLFFLCLVYKWSTEYTNGKLSCLS